MTQYLLSVIHPYTADSMPDGPPDDEMLATFAAVEQFNTDLIASGRFVFAGGLTPVDDARVARTADGIVTDGPYLETKEHLGGFWVVDVEADEIDEVALAAAVACRNDVEVRPFQPEPDPDDQHDDGARG